MPSSTTSALVLLGFIVNVIVMHTILVTSTSHHTHTDLAAATTQPATTTQTSTRRLHCALQARNVPCSMSLTAAPLPKQSRAVQPESTSSRNTAIAAHRWVLHALAMMGGVTVLWLFSVYRRSQRAVLGALAPLAIPLDVPQMAILSVTGDDNHVEKPQNGLKQASENALELKTLLEEYEADAAELSIPPEKLPTFILMMVKLQFKQQLKVQLEREKLLFEKKKMQLEFDSSCREQFLKLALEATTQQTVLESFLRDAWAAMWKMPLEEWNLVVSRLPGLDSKNPHLSEIAQAMQLPICKPLVTSLLGHKVKIPKSFDHGLIDGKLKKSLHTPYIKRSKIAKLVDWFVALLFNSFGAYWASYLPNQPLHLLSSPKHLTLIIKCPRLSG